MTLESLKLVGDIVQSFSVGAAVLIGGAWAAYQFISTRRVRIAKYELIKLQGEVTALQRTLRGEPIVDVKITTHELPSMCLCVYASLTNNGTRAEFLDLNGADVRAIQVALEGEAPRLSDESLPASLALVVKGRNPMRSANLVPGETIRLPYLFRLPEPGIYYIGVGVPGSADHRAAVVEAAEAAQMLPGKSTYWFTGTFVSVGQLTKGAT